MSRVLDFVWWLNFTPAIIVAVVFYVSVSAFILSRCLLHPTSIHRYLSVSIFTSSPSLGCLVLLLTQRVNMQTKKRWVRAPFLDVKLGPLARANLAKKRIQI